MIWEPNGLANSMLTSSISLVLETVHVRVSFSLLTTNTYPGYFLSLDQWERKTEPGTVYTGKRLIRWVIRKGINYRNELLFILRKSWVDAYLKGRIVLSVNPFYLRNQLSNQQCGAIENAGKMSLVSSFFCGSVVPSLVKGVMTPMVSRASSLEKELGMK